MPSAKNDGGEIYKYLTNVQLFVVDPAGLDTTTTQPITNDMATTTLTSITGLSGGEFLGIFGTGGGELMELTSAATLTATWKWPLLVPQASGARVVEVLGSSLLHIAEGGVQIGASGTTSPINAATSRTAVANYPGTTELTFSIPTMGQNNQNLAAAFGAPLAEIGDGTSTDPWGFAIGGHNIGTLGLAFVRLSGTLFNGDIAILDLTNVTIEPNTSATFGDGSGSGWTVAGKHTGKAQRIYTP